MTHAELVDIAEEWLRKRRYKNGLSIAGPCPVIVKELATQAGEIPDVLGWRGGVSVLIEAKASRSDFLADHGKFWRQHPGFALGRCRWYICPEGIITVADLPPNWGLLWVDAVGKVKVQHDAVPQPYNLEKEIAVLLSVVRRQAGWKDLTVDAKTFPATLGMIKARSQ